MTIKVENGSITYDGEDLKDLQDKARQHLDAVRPPEGTPATSQTETPYAVICRAHGQVFLTEDEYGRQLCRPDSLWTCPTCGRAAQWDDDHYEKHLADLDEVDHLDGCVPPTCTCGALPQS